MAPLSNAERQRRYIARLKAAAAANGKQSGSRPVVTNGRIRRQTEAIGETGLSIHARTMLKRLARFRDCSPAALIERLVTAEEHRVVARLKGKAALQRYRDGQ